MTTVERRSLGSLLAEHLAELEAERAAINDPASPAGLDEPASSGVFDEPASSAVFDEPASSRIFDEPASSGVFDDPASSGVLDDPASSGVINDPAEEAHARAVLTMGPDPEDPEDHVTLLPTVPAQGRESIADLADRLGDDLVDADDVVAAIGEHGLGDDEAARRRYGMSLHGVGISVLRHLETRRVQRGIRRAPAKRPYLTAAVLRCALYLGPLSVAVAAAPALRPLHPAVPAVILLLGWSAAQAMTSLGAAVAHRAGPAPAARLVGGGFLAAGAVWGALVWVAPAAILGGQRVPALLVGLGGLTALATVTAALVTRTEAGVLRWSLPCWLLGALSLAAAYGGPVPVPVETLLPAAIVVAAVRAYRPVIMRRVPDRPRLTRRDAGRGVGHLALGAAQAGCLVLLCAAGPGVGTLPLLVAVPALETLVGWHVFQVAAGLDVADNERDYRQHVRSVAVTTVAALLPPLCAGIALAAAAYRLPAGTATRDGVLALAAGTLLGGLLAITFLIAARGRITLAAVLAVAAPLAVVARPLLPVPAGGALPALVAALAATHLLGLLAVAHTAAQIRRPS